MIYNDLYCQFIVLLLIFRCNLAISYIAYVSIKDINISRLIQQESVDQMAATCS